MTTKRLHWIDIAKGLAILAVIVGHTYSFGYPLHALAYSFHIPLFFIMAGYTSRVKPQKQVLLTSAKRLLLPFAALCLFMLLDKLVRGPHTLNDLVNLFAGFAFASGGAQLYGNIPSIGVAWFLMALFVARICYNPILDLFERKNIHWTLQLVIVLGIAILAEKLSGFIMLPFSFWQAMIAMLFMHMGYLAKRYDLCARAPKPITIGTAAIWAIGLYFGLFFSIGNLFFPSSFALGLLMTTAASWTVIQLCILIDNHAKHLGRFLKFAGINSMLILCFHGIELMYIDWSACASESLGYLSPILAGCLHVMLVLTFVWFAMLCPIVKPSEN